MKMSTSVPSSTLAIKMHHKIHWVLSDVAVVRDIGDGNVCQTSTNGQDRYHV